MDSQTMVPEVISESSLALIMKAEIDISISTAHAFPRSLKKFLDKALSMATASEEVAAACSYSLPRAGKALDGPTVRLAEIVCSAYGNIRAAARVIANDGRTITAQGICHDLESNYSATVEVKRKITDRNGKVYSDDMQVVTGNAACAIAYRNAVFKVVPSALVSEIYDQSRLVAKGTAETLVKRRDKALVYAKSVGITDKQICEVLEIKKVEDIDLDKLETLRGMLTLIKNGESTAKDLFSMEEISLEDLQELYELKLSELTDEEVIDMERILKNKEKKSYSKMQKILQSK